MSDDDVWNVLNDTINEYPGIVPTADWLLARIKAAGLVIVPKSRLEELLHIEATQPDHGSGAGIFEGRWLDR